MSSHSYINVAADSKRNSEVGILDRPRTLNNNRVGVASWPVRLSKKMTAYIFIYFKIISSLLKWFMQLKTLKMAFLLKGE